jgi:flagellar hook protein FlgE
MSFNIGLSGLKAANKSLDVAGNNIANVATVGFKSSRAEFADQYAQSIRGTSGGTDVGNGVYTSAVTQNFSQGSLSSGTGRSLDLAIQGNGFFMVSNNGEKLYTRAGNFHTDPKGYVVDNNGNNLQGYGVDANGNVQSGVLADLRVDSSNMPPKPTSLFTLSSNLDSTQPIISKTFDVKDPSSYTNTISTSVYDSQGNEHTLSQYFTKTGTNTWSMHSLMDGRNISNPGTDPVVADETELTFDSSGNLLTSPPPTSTANISVNPDGTFNIVNWVPAQSKTVGSVTTWGPNGASANPSGIKLDMLATTQTAAPGGAIAKHQDGNNTGQITNMQVDASGNMFATYSNGLSRVIGQVSLTTFANVQGLEPAGGTMWRESYASGTAVTGAPDTGTLGYINGSSLEESNVDLSDELVELIKAQANYQANSKTISTENAILQTTIQMT